MSARLLIDLGFALAILLLLAAGVGYFYYSQDRIQALTVQMADVTAQAAALRTTNQQLTETMTRNKQALATHDQQILAIRAQADKLKNTLAKHNLQQLSASKPNIIEQTINKSLSDYFNSLQALSK